MATVPGLTDPEVLRAALEGSDAALSGVGPRGREDGPVASSATRGMLRAMEASGVRPFVAVSAVPVGPVPEGESFVNRRLLLPFISAFARDIYADLAEMEDEIRHSATEWTIVRPPRLAKRSSSASRSWIPQRPTAPTRMRSWSDAPSPVGATSSRSQPSSGS